MRELDDGKKRGSKCFVHGLFLIYLAVLLRITVFRQGFGSSGLMQNGRLNMTLFESYVPLWEARDWQRIIYLFVGNIIWFVPFGMYPVCVKRVKSLWKVVLAGLLLSLLIETLQYVFGTGVSEADDLILNSLGTLIGALCGKGILKIADGRVKTSNVSLKNN